MNTVYPVGSLYFGIQSTCPLATVISGSTWEKVASNIALSISNTAPVVGNGMAVGLTNGDTNTGLVSDGIGGVNGTANFLMVSKDKYGKDIGTSTGNWVSGGGHGTLGITTDSSKSGIVAKITSSSLTVNIWKRTA